MVFICQICGSEYKRYEPPGRSKYCSKACHNEAQRLLVGELNPQWKGGTSRWIDRQSGYVFVKLPNGKRIQEHRLIMQRIIGRDLFPEERVHHRNGIRDDNRDDNLQLMENNADHQKQHAQDNPDVIHKHCEICDKEIRLTPAFSKQRFCSMKCYGRWRSVNMLGKKNFRYIHGKRMRQRQLT
jgi:predicted nucleic acid-binding Zn ribbon protein